MDDFNDKSLENIISVLLSFAVIIVIAAMVLSAVQKRTGTCESFRDYSVRDMPVRCLKYFSNEDH